jgi:TFIIF-interacting CTD phosphatase-like protein
MMTSDDPKLLVLDLDETIIFSCETPLDRPASFIAWKYHVYKRPFVDEFLLQVREWFKVAVWTSSSPDYAHAIVNSLFPKPEELAFVWGSDRCTLTFDPDTFEYHNAKRLIKLKRKGYRLENVIVVDDSPEKHRNAYGNLVQVLPYNGASSDDELRKLTIYLEQLRSAPNIRSIEKRWWRNKIV